MENQTNPLSPQVGKILNKLQQGKEDFVNYYGKDAEKVMVDKAIKLSNKMNKKNIEKLVKETLKSTLTKHKTTLDEAYVPDNIKKFAKQRGVSSLVNKVAGWAEKVGKGIKGGTAIGKNYSTLVLDMGYQTSDIYIDTENETIELYGEEVNSFPEFKKVYDENNKEDIDENTKGWDSSKDTPEIKKLMNIADDTSKSYTERDKARQKAYDLRAALKEDIDIGHEDDEPNMIKADLYQLRKDVNDLCSMVEKYDNMDTEVDFPAWWQEKITTSKAMLSGAKEYLDFESNDTSLEEKKLTKAEKKKKEEIVKGMKGSFKGSEAAMYAIATDKAKKLAEMNIDEGFLDRLISNIKGTTARTSTSFDNLKAYIKGDKNAIKDPILSQNMAKLQQKAKTLDKELNDVMKDMDILFPKDVIAKTPEEFQTVLLRYANLLKDAKRLNTQITTGNFTTSSKPSTPPTSSKPSTPPSKSSTPPRDASGRFISKKVAEAITKKLKEINSKQNKLSSAEYQKAKKQKDFKASDWNWNKDEQLYIKK